MTETFPQMGAFYQPRYLGDDETLQARFHYPEDRLQCGEGIAGYLWSGRGRRSDKSGFTRIRIADDSHIRNQPHFQDEGHLPGLFPLLGDSRCLVGRRGIMDVPFAASATASDYLSLTRFTAVGNHPLFERALRIEHHRPGRHAEDKVFSVVAVLFLPEAAISPSCLVELVWFEVTQTGCTGVCNDDDIPAVSAVSSVRSSEGHVFLPPEARRTVSSVTGFHSDLNAVKHDN